MKYIVCKIFISASFHSMKPLFLLVSLLLPLSCYGEVVFNKINGKGDLIMTKKDNIIDFTINQDNTCKISGKATMIDDNKASYTAENFDDLCTIVFYLTSENDVIITSKSCCSLIDGPYQRHKRKEEAVPKSHEGKE